jgi:hypothetical protein
MSDLTVVQTYYKCSKNNRTQGTQKIATSTRKIPIMHLYLAITLSRKPHNHWLFRHEATATSAAIFFKSGKTFPSFTAAASREPKAK